MCESFKIVRVEMKNVTIALDERILKAGRRYAREQHTSLNNLIRELLEKTVMRPGTTAWTEEFFALADQASGNSRGKRWKREDLYGD